MAERDRQVRSRCCPAATARAAWAESEAEPPRREFARLAASPEPALERAVVLWQACTPHPRKTRQAAMRIWSSGKLGLEGERSDAPIPGMRCYIPSGDCGRQHATRIHNSRNDALRVPCQHTQDRKSVV